MTHPNPGGRVETPEALVFWPLVLLSIVCVYFAWYPGLFNADENDILTQALGGRYHDGHSPLLVRLWQLAAFIKVGPALPYFVAVASAILFSGLLLRRLLPPAVAAAALVVFVFLPPVFVSLGLVTKDLFFASSMLAAMLCTVRYVEKAGAGRAVALLAVMLICVLVRRDAVFALLPVILAVLSLMLVRRRIGRWAAGGIALAIAMVVVGVLAVSAEATNRFALRAKPFHPEQPTMLWDLAAISLYSNDLLIPPARLGATGFSLEQLRARFNSAATDWLIWGYDTHNLVFAPDANHAELRAAWMKAVVAHPLAYLHHRAEYWARYLGIRNDSPWFLAQFQGDETLVESAPEHGWRRVRSALVDLYGALAFAEWGHQVYLPWVWLILGGLAFVAWTQRNHDPPPGIRTLLVMLMVTSALAHTFFMGIASASAAGRYHAWPRIALGLVISATLFEVLIGRRRRSAAGTFSEPVRRASNALSVPEHGSIG
ncbi:MAG TPA: hypothetical protein VGK44_08020 [Casimicrobiaceae bacterium]|jgi:hypothetical protein